jgi:hypothetical protein
MLAESGIRSLDASRFDLDPKNGVNHDHIYTGRVTLHGGCSVRSDGCIPDA